MAQFYQYGYADPSSNAANPRPAPTEPILYQYIPAGQAAPEPPQPAAATIQMTQQISYGGVPIAGQQAPQVQFAQHQAYQAPAQMVAAPQLVPGAVPWVGATRAEITAQNIAIAKATGATRPQSLVPYKPADGQQWWCRELDGSYTLRTTNDITDNLHPGKWIYSQSGFPYFVRQA